MSRGRISFGCYVDEDYVYVAGGLDENGEPTDFVDKLALRDLHNNEKAFSWIEMPSLPEKVYNCAISIYNTHSLISVGGSNAKHQSLDSICVLDMKTDKKWKKIRTTLPSPACNVGLCQLELDKMVIFGGFNDGQKLKSVC